MVNSKRKGGFFERETCKKLSLWVSDGKRVDCLWRSAMSGGRATVHGAKVRQAGDICSVSPEGHALTNFFFIECKHVANLRLTSFMLNDSGDIAKYWRVACQQADAHSLQPMLIAKQNSFPTLVILRRVFTLPIRRITCSDRQVVIFQFDDLLQVPFNTLPPGKRRM